MENAAKVAFLRRTWVEVDLDAIANNFLQAKKTVGPRTRIAAVVKANAYGHGALEVAKLLIENDVYLLAVACLSEALELRAAFADVPILVMGYTPSEQLAIAAKNNVTLTLFSLEQAQVLSRLGTALNKTIKVHVKIDTGLNRIGLKPGPAALATIFAIFRLERVEIEGIFTHLALASQDTDRAQFQMFMDLIRQLQDRGIAIPIKHVCDGIGMVQYPEFHLDMVRVGSFLYGIEPPDTDKKALGLRMALTFKTEISHIKTIATGEGVGYEHAFVARRPSRIGTLPVGYVDGWMRSMAGRGEVSLGGRRAPIVGIMCMDQCMIDLTDIPEAKVGDEVVLMGENARDSIPIHEIANHAGTIRNEILTLIGRRVPRVYLKGSRVSSIVDYLLDPVQRA